MASDMTTEWFFSAAYSDRDPEGYGPFESQDAATKAANKLFAEEPTLLATLLSYKDRYNFD